MPTQHAKKEEIFAYVQARDKFFLTPVTNTPKSRGVNGMVRTVILYCYT